MSPALDTSNVNVLSMICCVTAICYSWCGCEQGRWRWWRLGNI